MEILCRSSKNNTCMCFAVCISNRLFESKPNENCSHLSEKESKGRFLEPKKLQNHSNEERGKEKKKERGEGKEDKRKKQWLHS